MTPTDNRPDSGERGYFPPPCPKCYQDDVYCRYREEGEWRVSYDQRQRYGDEVEEECFDLHCRTCGYDWIILVADHPSSTEAGEDSGLDDALYGMSMARLHGESAERLIREEYPDPSTEVGERIEAYLHEEYQGVGGGRWWSICERKEQSKGGPPVTVVIHDRPDPSTDRCDFCLPGERDEQKKPLRICQGCRRDLLDAAPTETDPPDEVLARWLEQDAMLMEEPVASHVREAARRLRGESDE